MTKNQQTAISLADRTLLSLVGNATVAWHEGGQLFAGDETFYPSGWYVFVPDLGAYPVKLDMENFERHNGGDDV